MRPYLGAKLFCEFFGPLLTQVVILVPLDIKRRPYAKHYVILFFEIQHVLAPQSSQNYMDIGQYGITFVNQVVDKFRIEGTHPPLRL